ncbi:MAG TPA: S9 family peptidase [Bryobacteraceae bacterium]|nr:S9 family peptidase [Bryobacteraceae bacterium]
MLRKVLLCAILAAAAHATGKTNLTSATLWDWRTATNPEISRDGKVVVYVLGWNDRMNDAMYSNLWMASTDGRDNRPITQGSFHDSMPRWSPDGKRLAYLSNRSGKTQIHVRWMDTGQDATITDLEHAPANIAWSPDGAWIAYTSRVPAKPDWSVNMPEKPAGAKWAEPPIIVTRLHWRQDHEGLIKPGFTHVFIVSATGGAPREIAGGDFDYGPPAWTQDGEWILTSSSRMPEADYNLEGPEIYAIGVKDGAVRQLTHRKGPDMNPVPSPDGKRIAYTGYDFKRQSYTVTHLYIMDTDGGNARLLAGKLDRDARSPVWSADSSAVYFTAEDRGAGHLFRAKLDGSYEQITSGKARYASAYASGDAFTVSNNGQVAIERSTPSEPADIVTFSVDHASQWTRLTSTNDSLLADRNLGSVEEISYDSFDGRPIEGWIVKPPGFDPSKKYPMILEIHGGPHAMYGVEFAHEFQVQAGRGFVVLYTNPRGSTGYGEEFGNTIDARYPGDDFKDLMAGVDAVLAKGYVDPKRLAVTGGSGGGLLTAWAIGHTDRFAAAVSQYPVTDWITQVGTADAGYFFAEIWMKGMPWENPKQYMDHSPVFFAENFKTPTMVITGESDYRTPMEQSEQLYFALKARKVPAVLVRVPDEPHGIRGTHPSHRIAKMEQVLGWIEKYTK